MSNLSCTVDWIQSTNNKLRKFFKLAGLRNSSDNTTLYLAYTEDEGIVLPKLCCKQRCFWGWQSLQPGNQGIEIHHHAAARKQRCGKGQHPLNQLRQASTMSNTWSRVAVLLKSRLHWELAMMGLPIVVLISFPSIVHISILMHIPNLSIAIITLENYVDKASCNQLHSSPDRSPEKWSNLSNPQRPRIARIKTLR